jgi:hypothetical protein
VLRDALSAEDIQQLTMRYATHFGVNEKDAAYFWAEEKVANETYVANEDGIKVKFKNGELKDITDASDMFNLDMLSKEATKLYLCYLPMID